MIKIISLFFCVSYFVTPYSFAGEIIRTTCFKHSNYDVELVLVHSDGELKAIAFNNSDWSTEGPELAVRKLENYELSSTYQIESNQNLLTVDNKIFEGKEVHSLVGTEVYDCFRN